MGDKLTPKQERFVQEYLVDLNATQAAIRAGYSEHTAQEIGSQNLSKLMVAEAIAEAQKQRAQRVNITQDMVLKELSLLGFANMQDYITISEHTGDALIDFSKLTRDQAAAIGEITTDYYTEGGGDGALSCKKVKFKLLDKRGALVDIGKHLGMFVERHEHGKPGDFSDLSDAELADIIKGTGSEGTAEETQSPQGTDSVH